jgi:hypothetical protein
MASVIKLLRVLTPLLISSISYSQSKGDIEYRDKVYDDFVKTVQLYPASPKASSQTLSPVIGLRSNIQLLLEFDELFSDVYSYKARIIHCNANWQPSGLSPLQYLVEYNEYDIN